MAVGGRAALRPGLPIVWSDGTARARTALSRRWLPRALTAVGGIPPLALAEDQALWDGLVAAGARVFAAGDVSVTTSGRREGRAPGGFAAFLRRLDQAHPPPGLRPCPADLDAADGPKPPNDEDDE